MLVGSSFRNRVARRAAALLALACLTFAGSASATIVERVVAVVGERPILLSELRQRAKPFQQNLQGSASERAAGLSQLYGEMLHRMVDEQLLSDAAAQAQISVGREEVDAAIERVAAGNNVSREELMAEIQRSGLTRAQYRAELRRQLLDAKVVNLRLQGQIRVSDEDLRAEYARLVQAERRQLEFRAAAIRLELPDGSEARRQLMRRASQLTEQARNGADFAQLSRTHSTDPELQRTDGLLPSAVPTDLPVELQQLVTTMDVGEVSAPVTLGDEVVIYKLLERQPSELPPFEEVAPQLQQRVQLRKMETARRRWLEGLRKRTHVEVRL